MAQPSPSSPSQREAPAPSSPPTASSQPLAPQSPYVVISSSSSRDRPSRRLRIPSDYSVDGSTAEAVIAATGEGSPLLASRRDLANREGGVRGSIYALQDGDGTDAQQPLPGTGIVRRPRPRFWYLLPLLSLLDVLLETIVAFPLLFATTSTNPSTTKPNPDSSIDSTRVRTLTATLLSACMLRCATLSIISIGNRTDQLGLIVAGVCAASALVGVSVFNLLFQEGALSPSSPASSSWRDNLPTPTLTLLTSLGLGFTVLEYILYVIVVGIRVPPSQGQAGGVRRMGDVRRWKRGVRAVGLQQQGQGGGSDWSVYMDEEDDDDAEEGEAGEDVEPTRKRRRASYVDPATTLTPGNSGGNLEAAGSSGSKSSSLLLLPEAAITTPPPTSTSYGALEASRPLSSLLPQSAFSAASTGAEGSVRAAGTPGDRRRTTSTTSTRSRGGLDAAFPPSSSASPVGSTGRLRLSASPSRSPSTNAPVDLEAAAAAASRPHSSGEEGGEDDEEEDADPNEILDIPSFPSSTSRDASRMRLAMASEPASSRGRRLSAIRGGEGEESREEVEERTEEVNEPAVPQRRRGWRTGGGAGAGVGATSLLPFKRKKPQRGDSGTAAAGTDDASTQSSGGGWRAGGRRLLRSALPGGGGTSGSGSRS